MSKLSPVMHAQRTLTRSQQTPLLRIAGPLGYTVSRLHGCAVTPDAALTGFAVVFD
jgi:hypothetical protein